MKKILFITATHGNEAFSIPVLKRIESMYSKEEYGYDWIIANERALSNSSRFVDVDMNRSAPGDFSSALYEEVRAAEVIQLARTHDLIIDIHGSLSDCGITTLIPLPTWENIQLARLVGVKRNVIWYSEKSRFSGPLVQFIDKPSIELECGPKGDPHTSTELEATITRLLKRNLEGTLGLNQKVIGSAVFFEVYGKVLKSGKFNGFKDFIECRIGSEVFYPYLSSNTYPETACYKMRRIDIRALRQLSVDISNSR